MASQSSPTAVSRVERWIALALCAAVFLAGAAQQLVASRPGPGPSLGPLWLPLAAAALAAAGVTPWSGVPKWLRIQRALLWSGLLLMVWAANGLPLDLLRLTPLMPFPVDWPGLVTKTLALAAAVALARLALARPPAPAAPRPATWYGYAAFALALPYPVLRVWWALGGTPGLSRPGAGGEGFAPLLLTIPWLLAAFVSLLLVSPPRWLPRRLLLIAGWTGTTIVAMIGPAACWVLVVALVSGRGTGPGDMATWVFALFYGSWLLWAIAAGAATRSYQLRSAGTAQTPPEVARQDMIEAGVGTR